MAGRSKTVHALGSAQWIQNERDQAQQLHDLEAEEFTYAATNELDWLNEHMADIFSQDVQRNFADVFKTPGKLRAKTPMTARKRLPARTPLGDLFAPHPQPATNQDTIPNTSFYDNMVQFKLAEDVEPSSNKSKSRRSPLRPGKENIDSGYHGITEDEMDLDSQRGSASQSTFGQPSFVQSALAEPDLETLEEHAQPGLAKTSTQETDQATIPDEDMKDASLQLQAQLTDDENRESGNWQVEVDEDDDSHSDMDENDENDENHIQDDENDNQRVGLIDQDEEEEDEEEQDEEEDLVAKSPSDVTSPENKLVRKSSLSFAALPAREPVKRSIGARSSHIDTVGRHNHGKSLGASQQTAERQDEQIQDDGRDEQSRDAAQVPSRTSTQRLHDKITALGQSNQHRQSKSIPSLANNPGYPVLPKDDDVEGDNVEDDDDDDDWIAPINPSSRQGSGADTNLARQATMDSRPSIVASVDEPTPLSRTPQKHFLGHQKSFSTLSLMSPGKLDPPTLLSKTTSVSNPDLAYAAGIVQGTTPSSAHSKRFADAPLSASKAKLYSVLKSARGIFANSANASAQAKADSFTSSDEQLAQSQDVEPDMSRMPGRFDSNFTFPPKPIERLNEGRRTRSSTESDRKTKEKKSSTNDLEKAREQERKKAAEQKAAREKDRPATAGRLESPTKPVEEENSEVDEEEAPAPPPPKALVQPGKLRAPGRLVRPARPATAPGTRPAPLNIKIASQSSRLGTTQATDRSLEPTPPPTGLKANGRARAGSTQPTGSKASTTSTARVKALEAAARKKEQDDKAAQRKIEQKRELERKRAAKAEEERRAEEERKAAEQKRIREERLAEQRRIQDARAAAQRQADQRKLEEQRALIAQEKARADQLAAALEQERQEKLRAQATYPRGDVQGTLRQLAQKEIPRAATLGKSSKRALDGDDEPQRPGMQRGPATYHAQDGKRRRTLEEEEEVASGRHSVMAPPKRPSNMRKNTQETLSKFPNGYAHAPPPAAHHTQGMNMYKATVTSQHQLQHAKPPMHPNDMLKLSTARIPFAESSNSAGPSSSQNPAFKTPGRPASAMPKSVIKSAKSVAKSSPLYANGENIALPEIQTDSEDDSDSDDDRGLSGTAGGFRAPSWVASPALRDLLTQQQLVDPESVFGPIAPLQMDEVFKGTKADRMKRFRERGSSARWIETGDAVTQEEKKMDQEMRGKLYKDGGWSYQQMH